MRNSLTLRNSRIVTYVTFEALHVRLRFSHRGRPAPSPEPHGRPARRAPVVGRGSVLCAGCGAAGFVVQERGASRGISRPVVS
jgi:hypothetical protein